MVFVISEKQNKRLVKIINNVTETLKIGTINEQSVPNFIRRRTNQRFIDEYLFNAEIEFPEPCKDFEDAYDYVDVVIDTVIDNVLSYWGVELEDEDNYSDILDYMRMNLRNWYGDYLIENYNKTCNK